MGQIERQREIETLLMAERKVLVEDLSQRFGVSEVTIRKDLTDLESRGVLLRTHGGAVIAEKPELVVPIHRRSTEAVSQKSAIARAAAMRIKDGESILLDTGSTTLALAREIRGRNINIVTNSVLIATELAADEQISIIVLGGTLRRSSFALMGQLALEQLKELHVDRAFLGASGFDPKAGFSCQNLIEAETKRAMAHAAHEAVVLVDNSKFENSAFAPFCTLKEIDCVVTDAQPTRPTQDVLQRAGIELVIAK